MPQRPEQARYYLNHKDDPAYKARWKKAQLKWQAKNRDKLREQWRRRNETRDWKAEVRANPERYKAASKKWAHSPHGQRYRRAYEIKRYLRKLGINIDKPKKERSSGASV
jgi:hypothetical protein